MDTETPPPDYKLHTVCADFFINRVEFVLGRNELVSREVTMLLDLVATPAAKDLVN